MLALLAGSAQATDRVKANNTTALNATGSWVDGVVPTASDRAVINDTVTTAISPVLGGNVSLLGIQVLNPGGTFTITATSGATLTIGTGGIDMSSATSDLTVRGPVSLNGDNVWNVAASRTLLVGGTASQISGSGGLTKLGSGTLNLYNQLIKGNTFTGNVIVGGGTVLTRGGTDWLGAFGSAGTITIQNGGTVNDSAGNNGPFGNPGTLKSGNVIVQTGGVLTMADGVTAHIPRVLVLSGGTLGSGTPHATYGTWSLEQGVIVNGGSDTSVISAQGVVVNQTGGTVFNVGSGATSGIDLDVTGYIGHFSGIGDRGVIKTGAGVMRLSGVNTYTSSTTISNGVLALSGSGSIASTPQILVCSGAKLDVSDLSSTFILGGAQLLYGFGAVEGSVEVAGGTVNPGFSSPAVVGTLGFSNNLALSSASSTFKLSDNPGSGANDQIVVAGDLTLNGVSTLRISYSALGTGRYKLLTYGGALTGSTDNLLLAGFIAGGRQAAYLDASIPNEIDLVVTGISANLTWVGDGLNNDWDTLATNWFNTGSAISDHFVIGDRVTFDDSGSQAPPVNLVGALETGGILVTNNGTYYFTGSGYLSGPGGLTKQGPGTLVMVNNGLNDFAGATTIGGGTLSIGADSALGAPPATEMADQLRLNGGTLEMVSWMTLSPTRGISLGTAGGALKPAAGTTVVFDGHLRGAGTLTVNGGGLLQLSAANPAFTGNVVISGSGTTVNANGGTTFGGVFGVAGTITIQNGAVLQAPYGNNGPFGISVPGLLLPGNVIVEAGGLLLLSGGNTTAHIPRMLVLSGGELASTVSPFNPLYGSWNVEQGVTANGGTATSLISASGVTLNQIGGTVFNVGSGAASGIDLDVTGSFDHVPNILNGDQGLIKDGPGVMRLSGINTYTSTTTIRNGVLALSGSGSIATSPTIRVSSGATFDVSTLSSAFTVGNSPWQSLGGSGLVTGNVIVSGATRPGSPLTFANDLTLLDGSTNYFVLTNVPSSAANSQIVVAGGLTLSGVSTIQLSYSMLGNGRYKLITYGGALSGDVSNLSLAGFYSGEGQTARLDASIPHEIDLVVEGTTPPQPVIEPNIVGAGTASATISWSAQNGINYQVQYKNDLNATSWSVLDSVTAIGVRASFTDTNGPVAQRFYRVVVP